MNPAAELISDLFHNPVFVSAASAWTAAQLAKVLIELAKHEFSRDRLTGSGGMPSSHSATVSGLAFSCLFVHSAASTQFALALFLAIVVIYDATGVRMETGREAAALNRLNEREIAAGRKPLLDRPLREKMGHTLPEVIVGIAIGYAAALIVCCAVFRYPFFG